MREMFALFAWTDCLCPSWLTLYTLLIISLPGSPPVSTHNFKRNKRALILNLKSWIKENFECRNFFPNNVNISLILITQITRIGGEMFYLIRSIKLCTILSVKSVYHINHIVIVPPSSSTQI